MGGCPVKNVNPMLSSSTTEYPLFISLVLSCISLPLVFFAEWKRDLEACVKGANVQCSFTLATSQVFRSAFFLSVSGPFPNRNVLTQVLPCAKDTSGKKFFLETKRASGADKEGIFERTTLRGKRGQLLESKCMDYPHSDLVKALCYGVFLSKSTTPSAWPRIRNICERSIMLSVFKKNAASA
jgi:hypothetical protein